MNILTTGNTSSDIAQFTQAVRALLSVSTTLEGLEDSLESLGSLLVSPDAVHKVVVTPTTSFNSLYATTLDQDMISDHLIEFVPTVDGSETLAIIVFTGENPRSHDLVAHAQNVCLVEMVAHLGASENSRVLRNCLSSTDDVVETLNKTVASSVKYTDEQIQELMLTQAKRLMDVMVEYADVDKPFDGIAFLRDLGFTAQIITTDSAEFASPSFTVHNLWKLHDAKLYVIGLPKKLPGEQKVYPPNYEERADQYTKCIELESMDAVRDANLAFITEHPGINEPYV